MGKLPPGPPSSYALKPGLIALSKASQQYNQHHEEYTNSRARPLVSEHGCNGHKDFAREMHKLVSIGLRKPHACFDLFLKPEHYAAAHKRASIARTCLDPSISKIPRGKELRWSPVHYHDSHRGFKEICANHGSTVAINLKSLILP